jgi:uncharacterized protein YkwD
MTNFIRHILIILAGLTVLTGTFLYAPVHAENAPADTGISPTPDEVVLFDLINAARQNPLGVAASLGMDPDKILNDFPELNQILTEGLPPLAFSGQLYQSADGHSRDMLDNGYYAYESLDGKTPADRMIDAGYVPSVSGESLGLLYFNNFISPEKAASQIFANIYRDELNPDWTGERNILNPDVKDLGVGMAAGLYNFNDNSGNVYLATCDFGAPIETYDLEMVYLVNQARGNPRAVAESLGMDIKETLNDFPELIQLFAKGVPPVSVNAQLYSSAKGHVADMMENGYYNIISPDGSTPAMRIRAAGYKPLFWAAESLARVSTCNAELPPEQTVPRIFKQMFLRAFVPGKYRDLNMFSSKAVDAGISIVAGESIELGGICGDFLHLATADYAFGKTGPEFALIGVMYTDANGNGLFDAGEGLPGVAVSIKAAGETGTGKITITDPAGGFTRQLAPGMYRVAINNGNNMMIKWLEVKDANVWLSMAMPASE